MGKLECVSLSFNSKENTKEQIQSVLATGTPMFSFTVNDGKSAVELLSSRLSGVFYDIPDEIEAYIDNREPAQKVLPEPIGVNVGA